MKMYFWMARSRGAQKQSRLGLLTGSGSALVCSDGQRGNPEKAERYRSGHGKSDPLETRRWAAKEIVPGSIWGTGRRKSLRPGGFEPPTDGLEMLGHVSGILPIPSKPLKKQGCRNAHFPAKAGQTQKVGTLLRPVPTFQPKRLRRLFHSTGVTIQ